MANLPDTTKPLSNAGQWLVAQAPKRTWGEALADVDGSSYPIDLPGRPTVGTVDAAFCAAAEALDTPEMHARIAPESKQALSRLVRDIERAVEEPSGKTAPKSAAYKGESHEAALIERIDRVVTLIEHDGVSQQVVFNVIGRALIGKIEHCDDITCAREIIDCAIGSFQIDHENEPASPAYEHDEFGRMAEYILRQTPTVTATSERHFYADNRPIPVAIINSLISGALQNCRIWDRHRNEHYRIDNRLITEVRCAMARKLIGSGRVPRQSHSCSASSVIDHPPAIDAVVVSNPVHQFAAERLVQDRGSWTASDEFWASWEDWCGSVGQTPGIRPVFFKELRSWGSEYITSAKRRTAGKLVHGYRGVRLKGV